MEAVTIFDGRYDKHVGIGMLAWFLVSLVRGMVQGSPSSINAGLAALMILSAIVELGLAYLVFNSRPWGFLLSMAWNGLLAFGAVMSLFVPARRGWVFWLVASTLVYGFFAVYARNRSKTVNADPDPVEDETAD